MTDYFDDSKRARRDALSGAPEGPSVLPDADVFSFSAAVYKPSGMKSDSKDLVPVARGNHNIVFGALVRNDSDVPGFVAYGLYKQNKRDWCIAFEEENRRPPDENEIRSYILGESTERRLATYRTLAAQLLQSREPEARGRPAPAPPRPGEQTLPRKAPPPERRRFNARSDGLMRQEKKSITTFLIYLVFLILAVVGIAWVVRYGATYLGIFQR